ncbi:MAG: Transcription-repair-coupling factor [Owenweeksia sp. TMED14]|nr:MAG: Transcription-repair-coupling factor [Owenweeksia sp. TMED14]|tara:strand:- start:586 stop:3939 length:3354 start_codon:yes stop_codon:yes gene_type:complete
MLAKNLITNYLKDSRFREFYNNWVTSKPGDIVHIHGTRGSLTSLIAACTFQKSNKSILIIRSDKEEAAYFLNDLEKLLDKENVYFFPDSYRRPYSDHEKVDNINIGLRTEALERLMSPESPCIIITYPEALAEKVITRKSFKSRTLTINVNEHIDLEFLNENLFELGFDRVDFVEIPGQFSVRGGIVDVFSFSQQDPTRIEFFGNEVESLRSFSVESQLSVNPLMSITLVSNIEDKHQKEIRQSLLKYSDESTLIWIQDTQITIEKMESSFKHAEDIHSNIKSTIDRIEPSALYLSINELKQELKQRPLITEVIEATSKEKSWGSLPKTSFSKNFNLLSETIIKHQKNGSEIWLMCGQIQQKKRLETILSDISEISLNINWLDGSLHSGWEDPLGKKVVFTDHEIFEKYHRFRLRDGLDKAQAITLKELNSLQIGDYVTHIDHGIGKFGGLQKIDVQGKYQEAIKLVYKDSDLLYVSIHSLHKISKFNSKEGTAPNVNKLGSPAWQNLKKKTKSRVKKLAYDLIKLYAKRKEAKGFSFSPDNYLQNELEGYFQYEDTPDQEKATLDVKSDMESSTPMDRLICGDVGFGKTEIAVRAAFKAVNDNKQVAILVPTTILAFQHYKTFKKRLDAFPVRVEYVNRSKSSKDMKLILRDLQEGRVDILIGTHKLVSKDVIFKDLGLLIIDEEQKFGVNVKDKLKTLKVNVDTLTLTATPIPRTMQFSLMAARDLSVMNTPPANRQPIETQIIGFKEDRIRDILHYEVSRGGQAFFIHNRVENIKEVAGTLQRLLPDMRIAIGHGKMKGSDLENILVDFMDGKYDILVSTTIVESGLDVPNANTMIIHQAQMFGLSDLHQMRGRVGRSNKKAFCYLISPPISGLPDESRKRLQALEQFSDLGSGFRIALRDLEIRGAGDLLGGEQSGFINDLGFETYQRLLSEAVHELKNNDFKEVYKNQKGGIEEEKMECQLDTDLELLFPDKYVNFVEERLRIYRDLNSLKNELDLRKFALGLEDRFGQMPTAAKNLLQSMRLRWLGDDLGLEKIILKSGKMIAHFPNSEFKKPSEKTILGFLSKIQENPGRYRMKQTKRLSLIIDGISSVNEALIALQEIQNKKHLLNEAI